MKKKLKDSSGNPAVKALQDRWLELALKEKYPSTPEVTKELDNLEEAIKQLNGEQ